MRADELASYLGLQSFRYRHRKPSWRHVAHRSDLFGYNGDKIYLDERWFEERPEIMITAQARSMIIHYINNKSLMINFENTHLQVFSGAWIELV